MSDGPLPPDWEATTDPSSGNTYYYNTKTNAVSWERPVTLGASAESLASALRCVLQRNCALLALALHRALALRPARAALAVE